MIPKSLAEMIQKREELTNPQLQDLIEKLKSFLPDRAKAGVPDSICAFAEVWSRGKWQRAKHLEVLATQLEEMEAGRNPRQLVSMPPRHGKSEMISFWFPIWLLARNPTRKVILCSYEHDFARTWGRRVRDFIIEDGDALGLKLNPSATAADHWYLTTGGGMVCAGAGGPITGKGAHYLIVDDPIKNAEEAGSENMRENLWEWWQTTAQSRLEPPEGYVVMVATRWHEDDLVGRLDKHSKTGEGLDYNIIKFPALAEEGDILGRELDAPLWPERHPLDRLLALKKGNSPYNWSAIYQQRPSPEEGGGVKRRWWQFYQVLPDIDNMDVVIQSWDLAFKDLKKSDYTVGQIWGRKGSSIYLIDQCRGHMNAEDVRLAILAFTAKYPRAMAKLIEDKANGPAVIATLQKKVSGMIPVKVRGSKDARLQAVIPMIAAGNIYLPHPDVAPRLTLDFIEECAAFPNGTNDDQLDAMTQALNYLQPQGWLSVDREERMAAKEAKYPKTIVEMQRRSIHDKLKKSVKGLDKKINSSSLARMPRHSGNW